jgi:hypothetical protein
MDEIPIDWGEFTVMSIAVAVSMLTVDAFYRALENNDVKHEKRKSGRSF